MMSSIARTFRIAFLLCSLVIVHGALLARVAEASESSQSKRLEVSRVGESGPQTTSASGRHQTGSMGDPFNTIQLRSPRFNVQPGVFFQSNAHTTLPPTELDLPSLYAKTDPFGADIPARTWQKDVDPIFIWQEPGNGVEIAGFSYSLDASPDDTVDTTATSWNVATDDMHRLTEGVHTFWVKAIGRSGQAGNAKSFEIWIDTSPPAVTAYSPSPGSLIATLTPQVVATVSEPHSGLDLTGVNLTLNGDAVAATLNQTGDVVNINAAPTLREGLNKFALELTDRVGNAMVPLMWTVTADVTPPTGSLVINGGALSTTGVLVNLHLTATDAVSAVTGVMISNDPLIGFVSEPFAAIREQWRLAAVRGSQTVYVKFVDGAGNVSEPVSASIELLLLSPETLITSGPAGVTEGQTAATFSFMCPEGGCVFAYAFDHDDWSEWSTDTTVTRANLPVGNHYFKVKAAKELNGSEGIQPDEEDPTPAERTWVVRVEAPQTLLPRGAPVKLWRLE